MTGFWPSSQNEYRCPNQQGYVSVSARQLREKLINSFDKILAVSSDNVDALSLKGAAIEKLGNPAEAITYYDKALSLSPNHVGALTNKGLALDDLGNYTGARRYFDKSLAILPNNTDTINDKGVAFDENFWQPLRGHN